MSDLRPNVRKVTSEERWIVWRGRLVRALRGMLAAALVVGSAFGAHALYTFVRETPRLRLAHVEILGAHQASPEEIDLLAGEILGTHILDLDTREIAAAVVRHPWVAWAEVRRQLPDSLTIEVLERTPAALLMAGDLYYLDGAGHPFKKVGPGEPMDLPILTGFDEAASPLRTDGALGSRAVSAAMGLIASVTAAGYEPGSVSEVHLDPDRGYSLFFNDGGAEVILGWEAFDIKLARLGKLQAKVGLELTRVARVDMDLDRAAVVTSLPREER